MPVSSLTAGGRRSITTSTSTGVGGVLNGVFTAAAMSITRTSTGTVTVQMEGSIDGTNYVNIGAANSVATAGTVIVRSTGSFLVSYLRPRVTANAAPGAVTISILGAAL